MAYRTTAFTAVLLGLAAVPGIAVQPAASTEPSTASEQPLLRLPAVETTEARATGSTPAAQLGAVPKAENAHTSEVKSAARSANSVMTGSVTVKELIALAEEDNPDIRAARLKASSMIERVPQAQGAR